MKNKRIFCLLLALALCAGLWGQGALAAETPEAEEPAATAAAETDAPNETAQEASADMEEAAEPEDTAPEELSDPEEAPLPEEASAEASVEADAASDEPELPAEDEEPPQLDGASVSNAFPFGDVSSGAWYYTSVRYAYYMKLMNGVGSNAFQPDGTTTRAMVVTVLWRMAGSPAPTQVSGFTDLTQAWYRDAVAWAQEKGIANGITAETFGPDRAVTREQTAAFVARYAAIIRGADTGSGADLSSFPDGGNVSSYARGALAWAVSSGIITGTTSGGSVLLDPRGSATRAQIATILMRFCKKLPDTSGDTSSLAYIIGHTETAERTNQIIAVVDHSLTLWERGASGAWTQTVDAYAGYGYNGLKADRREGDGTTPIGAFPLLYAFGRDADPGTDMTYRRITSNSYFSGASDSTYNTWVESSRAVTGEHLADYANLQYRWAMVIGFNTDPVVIGRGSAIFLHCKGNSWNTAGCVSVEQSVMLDLLDRVNDGAWIIIVKSRQDLKNY